MLNSKLAAGSGTSLAAMLAAAVVASMVQAAPAEENAEAEPFMLGTVVVVGKRLDLGGVGNDQVASLIDQDVIRRFNRDTLDDALNLLPGVTTATNSRNETLISVRGFDSRQVPLFIDGIPVYVPYDGYIDFDRFTTTDLAAIQVAKGFSSVAYGANALGGAINLISRKPVQSFEADMTTRVAAEGTRLASLNVGTNQGLWYLQAGASYSKADGFRLPSGFDATPTENGGQRDNAYREDRKLSLKIGLTPNETDEYAVSWYRQDGEKGQPPSTDPAKARYWRWPCWDKESLYFLSNTALGGHERIKLRFYIDRFDNEVNSYTDNTYRTLKTSGRGSVGTGRSIYDDETRGGSLTLESDRFDRHALRLVAHWKADDHREYDAVHVLGTHHKDKLLSYAFEDTIDLAPRWSLSLGFARHELESKAVFSRGNPYSLPKKQTANDVQAGLYFDWTERARLYATIARKSRLPTLKDRYSQRLGTYIENPGLRAEESMNYEIGYRGLPWRDVQLELALFRSDVDDRIQSVANVSGILSQMQNIGETRVTGVELGLRADPRDWLSLGTNLTWLELENRSNPAVKLTDMPRRKLTFDASLRPAPQWELIAFVEHDSSRWASNTVQLGSFTIMNPKAQYTFHQSGIALEAGVNNLGDREYELSEGFPNPGREWFFGASYRF